MAHFIVVREITLLQWTFCQGTHMNDCHENLNTYFIWLTCIELNKIVVAIETVKNAPALCSEDRVRNTSRVTHHAYGEISPGVLWHLICHMWILEATNTTDKHLKFTCPSRHFFHWDIVPLYNFNHFNTLYVYTTPSALPGLKWMWLWVLPLPLSSA